jgi:hypothetical protein
MALPEPAGEKSSRTGRTRNLLESAVEVRRPAATALTFSPTSIANAPVL